MNKNPDMIKNVGKDLSILANRLMAYATNQRREEGLSNKLDVELNLKIFDKVGSWYDKVSNNPGSLAGIVESLTKEDKDFLIKVKSLESSEEKKYFT